MEHADSLDIKASEEEEFCVIDSSDDQSENSRERRIEELLADVDKSITSVDISTSGNENFHRKINESKPADFTGPHIVSLNNSANLLLPDRDKMIALNQDMDNTPSENLNENRVENLEVSNTDLVKACGLLDCSQTEKLKSNDILQCDYDPFEKFGINQSLKLDNCDVDKLVMNHIQESSETLGEVNSIPEPSNVFDILLKSHQEFSESSKNPSMHLEEESTDMEENNFENSSCNFTTRELETETNGDNPCSPVFFDSRSFAQSDISDFEIDPLPLVKSCFVVLQRCDSLVNEYFKNMKHSAHCPASVLEMEAMSHINNAEVNKSNSKCLKLKTRELRKFRKSHNLSNSDFDVAEPHQETSNIKEAKKKEEYLSFKDSQIFIGNETTEMQCNANKTDENDVEECTSRLSLSISDASDIVDITQDTLNTNDKSKKMPKNKSPLEINDSSESDFHGTVVSKKATVKGYLNIINKNTCVNKVKIKKRTREILVEHSIAPFRNTSNFESHEENFKANRENYKKSRKRKSDMRDTLKINDTNKIFKTNRAREECAKNDNGLQFDVRQTEYVKDRQLNESDDSEIDSDCNTSKENFKTHEYMKRKDIFENANIQTLVSIERTEHELSCTKSQSQKKFMSVEQKEKNKPNYADKDCYRNDEFSDASSCSLISLFDQPEMELDYSLMTKPCRIVLTRCDYIDSEKIIPSSSNTQGHNSLHSDLIELSDLGCEDPQDWEEKKIVNKTPKLFSVSSDQDEDSRNEFVKTANEKKVKLKISDPSTSKGSGVNKEQLKFYLKELTQELKNLKKVMKRTERKMDILIKLHEQVLNC